MYFMHKVISSLANHDNPKKLLPNCGMWEHKFGVHKMYSVLRMYRKKAWRVKGSEHYKPRHTYSAREWIPNSQLFTRLQV